MRTGVIAKKMGMTRLFPRTGAMCPSPFCSWKSCQVVAHRTEERDGYTAVQLGAGKAKAKNVAKPQRGHFGKARSSRRLKVAEFRVGRGCSPRCRREITRDHFVAGQFVDVSGIPGQGLCRRDEALGLRRPARHPRRLGLAPPHGSTGQRQDPGRVFKNKKMAGHMGDGADQAEPRGRLAPTPLAAFCSRARFRARRAAGCWSRRGQARLADERRPGGAFAPSADGRSRGTDEARKARMMDQGQEPRRQGWRRHPARRCRDFRRRAARRHPAPRCEWQLVKRRARHAPAMSAPTSPRTGKKSVAEGRR